jgi:glycosyltransferase involved in cell wall biosynthesis
VSVVVPTRDRAALVGRAVRSILAQTWPHLEVVVVDDGSTDDSRARLQAIADPRLRVVAHARPAGPGAARNLGIQAVRGEWVAFLDSDDEWLPDRLEADQARLGAPDGRDATVVYCQATWRGSEPERGRIVPDLLHEGDVLDPLLDGWMLTTSQFSVRRRALLDTGGFAADIPAGQDRDLLLRLAAAGARFVAVPRALVIKHQHRAPRVSMDLEAKVAGYRALAARWGPLIVRRRGADALRHWRVLRETEIQFIGFGHVRAALARGDRRAAWQAWLATLRGMPRPGRFLIRGLALVTLGPRGWRIARAALRRGPVLD